MKPKKPSDEVIRTDLENGGFIYRDKEGGYHREDGPAYSYNGFTSWWLHNVRHREDGPALICKRDDNGEFIEEFWYHGVKIDCKNLQEFLRIVALKAFW